MKIGKRFKKLTLKKYFFYIDNYKKYSDFNRLGLYRSIIENENLSLSEKIEIRDYANQVFQKTFDFLQIKDPFTFLKLTTLGENITVADAEQIWREIRKNQEKILKDKKIKHRNFGIYSKHNCGYEHCHFNGLMIQQKSFWVESKMYFDSDKKNWCSELKSMRNKRERKNEKQIIKELLDTENY